MGFYELAKNRYSMRKFSNEKISKEKLDLILEAGRIAPTAVNYQPQRILVLQEKEDLLKLEQCTSYKFNQTLALLVCYDKNSSWKRSFDGKDGGDIDAAIVTTHMMLQASELGIGSTWVGHFEPQKFVDVFKIPENIVPVALLLMGYPSDLAKPHKYHNERFEISKTVYYGDFNHVTNRINSK